MKVLKKTGTIVLSVLLWVIILVAALYAFTTMATRDNQNVSNLMGYTPLVVKSDSMAPTFRAGDLIFIKKCDTSTLKEGDIICFHTIIDNEYALNTHRIQKIETSGDARSYTTLGDNNNGVADTHIISDGDIVGKYVGHLQNAGKVMDFLSSSIGFLIVIVLPMLLFFIYQVYNLIMISIRLKKAVAVEAAKEAALAQSQAAAQNTAAQQNALAAQTAATQESTAATAAETDENAAAQQNTAAETSQNEVSAEMAAAKAAKEEAEAAKAALEEARKLREEAEAIRAKAEKELAEAKKQQKQNDSSSSEEKEQSHKAEQEDTES